MQKLVKMFVGIAVFMLLAKSTVLASNEYSEGYFKYLDKGNYVSILSYFGDETEVMIPSSIGGKPVAEIEDYAFKGRDSVQIINMSQNVLHMGDHALEGMSNLSQVVTRPEKKDDSENGEEEPGEELPEETDTQEETDIQEGYSEPENEEKTETSKGDNIQVKEETMIEDIERTFQDREEWLEDSEKTVFESTEGVAVEEAEVFKGQIVEYAQGSPKKVNIVGSEDSKSPNIQVPDKHKSNSLSSDSEISNEQTPDSTKKVGLILICMFLLCIVSQLKNKLFRK